MATKQIKNISLIILAGGKSSRMGRDKALLKIQGKTLIRIIYDNLKDLSSEVIISTNNPKIKINGARIIPDKIKNIGPAGGIFSALSASSYSKSMIISVDTPFVKKEIYVNLLKYHDNKKDVQIISEKSKLHPLIGIYSKNFTETLQKEIGNRNYKIREIIKKSSYEVVDISEEPFFNKHILTNINTEEDYISALKYANPQKE